MKLMSQLKGARLMYKELSGKVGKDFSRKVPREEIEMLNKHKKPSTSK